MRLHAAMTACSLLMLLTFAGTAVAGEVLSVSPAAGTFGTQVTLGLDGDFGSKTPAAFLERLKDGKHFKLKVVAFDHADHTVVVKVKNQKALLAGSYSIHIEPKGKQKPPPFIAQAAFELVGPAILSVSPDTVSMGDVVTLSVSHLGSLKAPVKVAGQLAKILSWEPELDEVVIRLPKQDLPATGAVLSLESPLGSSLLLDALTIVNGDPVDGDFMVGGTATAITVAGDFVHVVPGSAGYENGAVLVLEPNAQGEPQDFIVSFLNPLAPRAADAVSQHPTQALFHVNADKPDYRYWSWAPGDPFALSASPWADGTIHWHITCTLSLSNAGMPPLKISGSFVSQDLNHPPLVQWPEAAIVIDGQVVAVDDDALLNMTMDFTHYFDVTELNWELPLTMAGVSYILNAYAFRDGVFDPASGPLTFSEQEVTIDLNDANYDLDWGSGQGLVANPTFRFEQLPGSSLLELTIVATLPGPGEPRTLHLRVLADSGAWL